MACRPQVGDFVFDSEQEKILSRVISTQLSLNGKTEREARIVHSFVSLEEFLLSTAFKETFYYGGSFGEATFEKGSDVDMMIVAPDIVITHNADIQISRDKFGHVFAAVRDERSPVYVKLKAAKLDAEDDDIHIFLEKGNEDQLFASSDKYVHYVVSVMQTRLKGNEYIDRIEEYFRNGPCASFISKALDVSWRSDNDLAYAIKCDSWPNDAEEWFSRSRENKFPSEQMLRKIRKFDCHVVATGDPLSASTSLGWRLSFLLAERELVRNFNEVQLKCFSVLKTILRSQIEDSFPNSLTTYHMKTTLFWVIEEVPQSIWTPENLLQCVRICLDRLSESVRLKSLSHYILRKENLFQHRLVHLRQRMDLHKELLCLASNPTLPILKHAKMGGLNEILEQYGVDLLIQICLQSMNDIRESVKEEQTQLTVLYSYKVFQRIIDLPLEKELSIQLENNEDLDGEFRNRVQMFLLLKMGLDEQRFGVGSDEAKRMEHLKAARNAFLNGSKVDVLTGRLYIANYQIMICEYETAKLTLIGMLSQNVGVVYFGDCSEYSYLSIEPVMRVSIHKSVPSKSGNQSKCGCGDILFRQDDIHSVPYAVQFECALSRNCFAIYPLVYAYFLFVVAYHNLGLVKDRQEAIDDLEKGVKITQGGVDRHRSYNLLAHAYLLAGNQEEAVKNFIQSATLFPSPKNAALYVIAILIVQNLKIEKGVFYSRT